MTGSAPHSLDQRCRALVVDLGLARPADIQSVVPLTGGVASDIAVVDLGARRVCVKFALPKLRVAQDWHAPLHRNKAEYAWLACVGAVLPHNVPRLFGRSDAQHGFAMEFLTGADVFLWKAALLAQKPPQGEAAMVGRVLGRIHAASTAPGFDAGPFHNRDDFRAIRLEPYLSFTASRHPDLASRISTLVEALYASHTVLVHGDVSPKNILFRNGEPIMLDAECATMGDAGFDLAFCLNHLILKAIHLPMQRAVLLGEATALWNAYATFVNWEPLDALQSRICALLPALMLARVDGKSPVEYLTDAARQTVRGLAIRLMLDPVHDLARLIASIAARQESA